MTARETIRMASARLANCAEGECNGCRCIIIPANMRDEIVAALDGAATAVSLLEQKLELLEHQKKAHWREDIQTR